MPCGIPLANMKRVGWSPISILVCDLSLLWQFTCRFP
jgi:hypothetical protein